MKAKKSAPTCGKQVGAVGHSALLLGEKPRRRCNYSMRRRRVNVFLVWIEQKAAQLSVGHPEIAARRKFAAISDFLSDWRSRR